MLHNAMTSEILIDLFVLVHDQINEYNCALWDITALFDIFGDKQTSKSHRTWGPYFSVDFAYHIWVFPTPGAPQNSVIFFTGTPPSSMASILSQKVMMFWKFDSFFNISRADWDLCWITPGFFELDDPATLPSRGLGSPRIRRKVFKASSFDMPRSAKIHIK